MELTTWVKLIGKKLELNGETWNDVIKCTLTPEELHTVFHAGYGTANGKPFTMWTENHVYFPAEYDGMEWCESVPRNPCDIATEHTGGG